MTDLSGLVSRIAYADCFSLLRQSVISWFQTFALQTRQLVPPLLLGNYAHIGVLLAVAYVFGGFATANLFLANHELSHNLAFKSASANRMLGLVANLPIGGAVCKLNAVDP
jgi:fatty acid desaturase